MKRIYFGEFEEIVLLTVALPKGNGYGVAITHGIIEQTRRPVKLNQVHAPLQRLEEKGRVTSTVGEATAKRGGRRIHPFSFTAYGQQTLPDIQATRAHLLNHLPCPLILLISL